MFLNLSGISQVKLSKHFMFCVVLLLLEIAVNCCCFFPCAVCRSLYRLQRQITSGCWHEFRGSCSFNCKSTQVSTLSYRHNTTTMWGSMVSQKPCLRFYDWDLLNMREQFLLPLTQGLLVYCCGPYLTLSTCLTSWRLSISWLSALL